MSNTRADLLFTTPKALDVLIKAVGEGSVTLGDQTKVFTEKFINHIIVAAKLGDEIYIVHPAAGSLTSFKKEVKVSEDISYASTSFGEDSVIMNIWKENEASIKLLVKMSILLPALCLKVLNSFDFEGVESQYIESCKVSSIFNKDKLREIDKMMEL